MGANEVPAGDLIIEYCGQIVALKFIPTSGRSDKDLAALRQEIEILRTLQHENLVLLLDYFVAWSCYFCWLE